mgnify:CR=1 FL=1
MLKISQKSESTKWMGPILDALRELGGSAKPRQVSDWIAAKSGVSDEQRTEKMKSGTERFHNQVCWARQYLVWEGLLDGSTRGVWKLTDLGAKTTITPDDVKAKYEQRLETITKAPEGLDTPATVKPKELDEDESAEEVEEQELLGVIQQLSPQGFERLCKRLLTEWGFEDIEIVGKSHDGGVDGTAVLLLNPFVSFDVAFQCKRYRQDRSVGREVIAGFRGSKKARHAEKLIFITTGYFTKEARKEANGDGVLTVELIDGEMLVELFEQKQLGLRKEQVFRVDYAFFDQFK